MSNNKFSAINQQAAAQSYEMYPEITTYLREFSLFDKKVFLILMGDNESNRVNTNLLNIFFQSLTERTKTFEEAEKILLTNFYRCLETAYAILTDEQILQFHKTTGGRCSFHRDILKIKPIYDAIIRDKKIDDILE